MGIHKAVSTERRTTASKYDVSRWTSAANTQALYKRLADGADADMMKADNLMFDPREMLTSGLPLAAADRSYRQMEMTRNMPLVYYVGGIVALMFFLKYLIK